MATIPNIDPEIPRLTKEQLFSPPLRFVRVAKKMTREIMSACSERRQDIPFGELQLLEILGVKRLFGIDEILHCHNE